MIGMPGRSVQPELPPVCAALSRHLTSAPWGAPPALRTVLEMDTSHALRFVVAMSSSHAQVSDYPLIPEEDHGFDPIALLATATEGVEMCRQDIAIASLRTPDFLGVAYRFEASTGAERYMWAALLDGTFWRAQQDQRTGTIQLGRRDASDSPVCDGLRRILNVIRAA